MIALASEGCVQKATTVIAHMCGLSLSIRFLVNLGVGVGMEIWLLVGKTLAPAVLKWGAGM